MKTLGANNPDGKGPVRDNVDKPTAGDPDPHNPPLKVIACNDDRTDVRRLNVQGLATNREAQLVVEAAEGEMPATPQGP